MTLGKTPTEAYANSVLARIEKWAKENQLRFNENKSMAMLISRHQCNATINMYLNNRRLNLVTEMKYLGIYFDCHLTFDKHVENSGKNHDDDIHVRQICKTSVWSRS
jgi:hypothetical protein